MPTKQTISRCKGNINDQRSTINNQRSTTTSQQTTTFRSLRARPFEQKSSMHRGRDLLPQSLTLLLDLLLLSLCLSLSISLPFNPLFFALEEIYNLLFSSDGIARIVLLHAAAAVAAATAVAAAVRLHRSGNKRPMIDRKLMPRMVFSRSGRVEDLERFTHYVARQLGYKDPDECPQLCKLAYDYLRKNQGCDDNIFNYFSRADDPESLYARLIEELDKCILGYFAFYWSHASHMISEVLHSGSEHKKRLKDLVLEATRKQRFERMAKDLKVTRLFSTLVEEMKAIGINHPDDSKRIDVMVPAAHSDRSPVLLLMGGGMGAGKSTVLKDILKEAFWLEAASNAVIVEADAFKETDVIYRAISSRGHHRDMLQTAELVHQSSTDAASSLLVTALNEGRDVIMDGTLSWVPFVEQTIAMARNVHLHRYRMGIGYQVADDGTIVENYWEEVEAEEQEEDRKRKPYRIELVGVVCDAYLAVVRGIRRAILMGRAVRVKSQLKSHKRFAIAFQTYCNLVDNARLYSTNSVGSPPKLIAWKDGNTSLLVEPQEIGCLEKLIELNEDADCVYDLYPHADTTCGPGSVWNSVALSGERVKLQKELRIAIKTIESQASS